MNSENNIEKPGKTTEAAIQMDKKTKAKKARLAENLRQNLKRRKNKIQNN
jgi:hypothetical protein